MGDYEQPVILTSTKCTVEDFCNKIHRTIVNELKYAMVWGTSVKFQPMRVGRDHVLTMRTWCRSSNPSSKGIPYKSFSRPSILGGNIRVYFLYQLEIKTGSSLR